MSTAAIASGFRVIAPTYTYRSKISYAAPAPQASQHCGPPPQRGRGTGGVAGEVERPRRFGQAVPVMPGDRIECRGPIDRQGVGWCRWSGGPIALTSGQTVGVSRCFAWIALHARPLLESVLGSFGRRPARPGIIP